MSEQAVHNAILESRARLTLSGVTEIRSFDDRTVILYTVLGELAVTGTGLKCSRLSTESGELLIEGEICTLRYGDRGRTGSSGMLGRLLR